MIYKIFYKIQLNIKYFLMKFKELNYKFFNEFDMFPRKLSMIFKNLIYYFLKRNKL